MPWDYLEVLCPYGRIALRLRPCMYAIIKMTKRGYMDWVVLWDANLALHFYAF